MDGFLGGCEKWLCRCKERLLVGWLAGWLDGS